MYNRWKTFIVIVINIYRGAVAASSFVRPTATTATPAAAAADSSRTGSRINKLHVQVCPRVPSPTTAPTTTTIATIPGHADADSAHAPPQPSTRAFAATDPNPTRSRTPSVFLHYYNATKKSSYIHHERATAFVVVRI